MEGCTMLDRTGRDDGDVAAEVVGILGENDA
jgi:hypothetical protein